MTIENHTVAVNDGEEIVKHYPFTDEGYLQAYHHAKKFGYELWESYHGQPIYLSRNFTGRTND